VSEANTPQTFVPGVYYKDPRAALVWLQAAFGFEVAYIVEDAEGRIGHSEMRFGAAAISVGGEWTDAEVLGTATFRSPLSAGAANTQSLDVHIDSNIDAHCERARAAGAIILREPRDEFWGDRRYRAIDPEGHVWSFLQHIRDVPDEEMRAALQAGGSTSRPSL
jgi:uncharacterized glyoxalase superfamily protein PhnB